MKITRKLIISILKQMHPYASIDMDVCDKLETLFIEYNKMEAKTLLDKLPGDLRDHAEKKFYSDRNVDSIIEYLLFEILELAGNCAKDYKKVRITLRHMWIAILNDEELKEIFPKPNVPILPHSTLAAVDIHGNYSRALKGNIVNKVREYNLKVTQDVYNIINNILNEASNYYLGDNDIISKIESLGKVFNINGEPPIRQLHNAILDILLEKLKNKNKVTFSTLDEVVGNELQTELDYLNKLPIN